MLKTFQKVISLSLFSTAVLAQQPISLDDVQVTTSRYPQKQTQTGKSVTIVSDSTLRALEGQTLSQILQAQSGIVINGKGQPLGAVQSISTRGAGFGETLILLDGIPVYEPSGIGNSFDINLISIQSIERIEILKDGQSTIYGSDALAGVINIITKKAASKTIQGSAALMGGSFNTWNADANLRGSYAKTQYNVGLSRLSSDGFSSAKGKGFEKDGYSDLGLNARVNQQLTQHLAANAQLKYQKYRTDFDEAAFVDDKDNTYKSDNWMYGAGLNYDFKTSKIIFNYLGSKITRTFLNDSTDVPAEAWNSFSYNIYGSQSHFFETYAPIQINSYLNALIGANHQTQNMKYAGYEISAWGRTDYDAITDDLAQTHNSSAYASLSANLKNGLGFELGGRNNWHSVYGNHFTYSVSPYYNWNNKVKVLGSWGTSFRNPALYQLYSPYGNLKLQAEEVKNYEVGLQWYGASTKDFIRAVYFGRMYKQMIIFESISESPWGIYTNLDQKNTQNGIEIEAQKTYKHWNWGANYTYLTGLISDNLVENEAEIKAFLRRPKHTLNLSLAYRFNDKWNASVQSQTLSKRNDSYYNSANYSTEAKILEAFTLVNVQAQYKWLPNLKLTLSAQNVFNVDYEEVYGYNARKATVLLGLRYDF